MNPGKGIHEQYENLAWLADTKSERKLMEKIRCPNCNMQTNWYFMPPEVCPICLADLKRERIPMGAFNKLLAHRAGAPWQKRHQLPKK